VEDHRAASTEANPKEASGEHLEGFLLSNEEIFEVFVSFSCARV